MVLDSHIDTPTELLRGRILDKDNATGHVDFPKLRRGGVDGAFFALYTSPETAPDAATRHALEMLAALQDVVEAHPEEAAFAFSADEVLANKRQGRISVLLGMENGTPIQESLSLLRYFWRQGVRYLTLTHNADNAIADSAAGHRTWGGLSPFGRSVVQEMNRLGMMVDLSHSSDDTFWLCLEVSSAPIIATHSSCRALCGHPRNLTDDMLRALGEKDGYVGINFYPTFLDEQWQTDLPGVEKIVDHIDHAVALAGLEHVGIGTDYDGIEVPPKGLEDIGKLPLLFAEMRRRGYSEEAISRISGDNLLEVMKRVKNAATNA